MQTISPHLTVAPDAAIAAARMVANAGDIEALPQAVSKALQLMRDPGYTIGEVASVVSLDEALTSKILRMANSAYFGSPRRIVSVAEAIVRLGYRTMEGLLLTASASRILQRRVAGYGLEQGRLWEHSIATAMGARLLAQMAGEGVSPEEAYVAGLLHDVGKVLLDRFAAGQLELVRELVRERQIPFFQAEQAVLGYDHSYVGTLVALKWGLPEGIAQAIGRHHTPLADGLPADRLGAVVHLADVVAWLLGRGGAAGRLLHQADRQVLALLNTTAQDIDDMMPKLEAFLSDTRSMLGL
jgi:putative nucleotidyltransferase with HDIG domain